LLGGPIRWTLPLPPVVNFVHDVRGTLLQRTPSMQLVWPVLLLVASNVFMTFAWYGHLKFKHHPLGIVILASWGIALFEYCLQVPANRLGSEHFTTAQLKTMQEVISLLVFAVFSVTWLGESLRWNHAAAFALLVGAVALVFVGK